MQYHSSLETVCVKVKWSERKPMIILSVYRPPPLKNVRADIKYLEMIIKEITSLRLDFVMCGDFNLTLPDHFNKLDRLLSKYQCDQLVKVPTRINSILDLIITNCKSKCDDPSVCPVDYSDHSLLQLNFQVHKRPPNKVKINFRNFRKLNDISLYNDPLLQTLQFSITKTSEENVQVFRHLTLQLFNAHVPVLHKHVRVTENISYTSSDTKLLTKQRDTCHRQLRMNPSETLRDQYKLLKNKVRAQIKSDARAHMNHQIMNNGLWKTVNGLMKSSTSQDFPFSADEVNNHFANISSKEGCDDLYTFSKEQSRTQLRLQPITILEVVSAWKSMKKKDSKCEDMMGLSNIMIKHIISSEIVLDFLCQLFNQLITTGIIPSCLKTSKIIPIPKKHTMNSCNDIRPISILPVLAKLFEKIVYKQVIGHLTSNSLIPEQQFGFRPSYTTTHLELCMKDDIKNNIRTHLDTAIVCLDIQKAFDTVDRKILVQKLKWHGIQDSCIISYIEGRSQCTLVNGQLSSSAFTKSGVPQGGCLSAIFYLIFSFDFPSILKHSEVKVYADDSQLYKSIGIDKENDICKLEEDIQQAVNWIQRNNMNLNTDKTEVLYISSKRNAEDFRITVNDKTFLPSGQIKTLGLIKDNQLKWKQHINSVVKSCNATLWKIRSFYNIMNSANLKILIDSLVLSKLYYMIVVWGDCDNVSFKKITKIFNSAVRVAKLDLSEPHIWLNPSNKFLFELANLSYVSLYNTGPAILNNKIRLDLVKEKRTRQGTHYYLDNKSNLTYLEILLTETWIKVPTEIKQNSVNLKSFKQNFKQYLLNCQLKEYKEKISCCCDYSCIYDASIVCDNNL